jgi:hypothetical protein
MWGTKGDLTYIWKKRRPISTCLEVKPNLHKRFDEFCTSVYFPNYKNVSTCTTNQVNIVLSGFCKIGLFKISHKFTSFCQAHISLWWKVMPQHVANHYTHMRTSWTSTYIYESLQCTLSSKIEASYCNDALSVWKSSSSHRISIGGCKCLYKEQALEEVWEQPTWQGRSMWCD